MDGGYRLRHPRRKDVATLAVHGATFRSRVPPQPPAERALASHAAAVAAMNAELVRLTSRGWEVDDVETATDQSRPEDPRPDDLDAVLTSLVREGSRVTIEASESTVTRDQALAALRGELSKGCAELVIQDAQPCDAPWYQTVAPWCSALASLGSHELERLVVDTYFETLTRQASVHCGDVTQVFRACPSLKFAYVIGCAEIHALAHDRLEDLTLMAEPLDVDTLRAVLRGPCPRLSRLALGFAYEGRAAAHADHALAMGFAGDGLPALRELHVAYPGDAVELLGALASSPRCAALRVLSIEGDFFDNERRGLAALKKHRAALSKLERLHLPIEDVTSKTYEELAAIVPCLHDAAELKAFSPDRYRTG
jgi:hypothetical protein